MPASCISARTLWGWVRWSTSFDDEVVEFFSPHAAGKDYMFVTVFGKRRRTRQS